MLSLFSNNGAPFLSVFFSFSFLTSFSFFSFLVLALCAQKLVKCKCIASFLSPPRCIHPSSQPLPANGGSGLPNSSRPATTLFVAVLRHRSFSFSSSSFFLTLCGQENNVFVCILGRGCHVDHCLGAWRGRVFWLDGSAEPPPPPPLSLSKGLMREEGSSLGPRPQNIVDRWVGVRSLGGRVGARGNPPLGKQLYDAMKNLSFAAPRH